MDERNPKTMTDKERHQEELKIVQEILDQGHELVVTMLPEEVNLAQDIRLAKHVDDLSGQDQEDATVQCQTIIRNKGGVSGFFTLSDSKHETPLIQIQFTSGEKLADAWKVSNSAKFNDKGSNIVGHLQVAYLGSPQSKPWITERCKEIFETPGTWQVEAYKPRER